MATNRKRSLRSLIAERGQQRWAAREILRYARKLAANHRRARPAVIRDTRDLSNLVLWAMTQRLVGTLDRERYRDLCGGALVLLKIADVEVNNHGLVTLGAPPEAPNVIEVPGTDGRTRRYKELPPRD